MWGGGVEVCSTVGGRGFFPGLNENRSRKAQGTLQLRFDLRKARLGRGALDDAVFERRIGVVEAREGLSGACAASADR